LTSIQSQGLRAAYKETGRVSRSASCKAALLQQKTFLPYSIKRWWVLCSKVCRAGEPPGVFEGDEPLRQHIVPTGHNGRWQQLFPLLVALSQKLQDPGVDMLHPLCRPRYVCTYEPSLIKISRRGNPCRYLCLLSMAADPRRQLETTTTAPVMFARPPPAAVFWLSGDGWSLQVMRESVSLQRNTQTLDIWWLRGSYSGTTLDAAKQFFLHHHFTHLSPKRFQSIRMMSSHLC